MHARSSVLRPLYCRHTQAEHQPRNSRSKHHASQHHAADPQHRAQRSQGLPHPGAPAALEEHHAHQRCQPCCARLGISVEGGTQGSWAAVPGCSQKTGPCFVGMLQSEAFGFRV